MLFFTTQVVAQEDLPAGPVYIVQPGDTLWEISRIFNVSLDDLAAFNGMEDPSQLSVGARLAIPGMDGLEGVLVIESVPYGENLRSSQPALPGPNGCFGSLKPLHYA